MLMADDADKADSLIESMIAGGMERARRMVERSLPITGQCHYCAEIVTNRPFCSKECAEDFQALQDARKRNG